MAATIQDDIWWKYVDQEKYFEMAEGDGRKYLTDVPRPNSYEMKKFDYHVSEICDFLQTFVLTILNILFWVLCRIYTKDSGFEVRLWDFVASTVLYILPNMLMIVSIYTLISLIFKNPLPGVPLLILYMVYSNLGGTNAEGVYGYWGKPLAIMVRFPGQLFDTTPPPMALLNQSFLIIVSVVIILISIQIWKRRRI